MAEKNENSRNSEAELERKSARFSVNRPTVNVGRIKRAEPQRGNAADNKNTALGNKAVAEQKNNFSVKASEGGFTVKSESVHSEKKQDIPDILKASAGSGTDNSDTAVSKGHSGVGAKLRDSRLGEYFKDETNTLSGRTLHRGGVDVPLLMIFIVLIVYGLLMVFSASYAYANVKEDNSYAFFDKQAIYLGAGIFVAFIIYKGYDYWILNKNKVNWVVWLYYAGAIALLLLIFVPGLGVMEGITRRWIKFGPISLQPSEFAKGALILTLAWHYNKYEKKIDTCKKRRGMLIQTIIPYFAIALPVVVLVFMEKHLSGTIILLLITILMVFTGEKNHAFTLTLLAIGLILVIIVISYLMQFEGKEMKALAPNWAKEIVTEYSWERIEAWLDPERFKENDELWQSTQGLSAIGSGGLMGVGYSMSRQKHMFVSQPQNDFVFTIVCEEMGFVGGMIVVILFAALIWRGYVVGKRIPDTFSRMAVWGLCTSIGMQAFLNMGVVTTLLPNTGISLPFFSYGGSSIFSLMIEVGIVLALSRYAQKTN